MSLYDNGWWLETIVNAIYRIAPRQSSPVMWTRSNSDSAETILTYEDR